MDKATLLKRRMPEADILLDGVGTVRVRGLSRAEVLELRDTDLDANDFERRVVSLAMVDPQLSEDEVDQWRQASLSDEIDTVVSKVNELSGLVTGAAKAAYKSNARRPRAGVRASAGAGPVDDGGGDAGEGAGG